jgi:hypothetical protein
VGKALGYKPDGRRLETRWGEILNLLNSSDRTRPWGSLSPSSVTEELLERKSSISALQSREYVGIHRADHMTTFYPQKLGLSSPAMGGRLAGIAS